MANIKYKQNEKNKWQIEKYLQRIWQTKVGVSKIERQYIGNYLIWRRKAPITLLKNKQEIMNIGLTEKEMQISL